MKRILLTFALLLAFALPAWGKVINWVSGGVSPTTFTSLDNWIDVATGIAPLTPPATGDTLQFLDSSKSLPALLLPNAGEVFVLVLDGASAGTAWNGKNITAFCGTNAYVEGVSGWTYSSLTVGTEGRNGDSIYLDRDSAAGGSITTYGVVLNDSIPTAIANVAITVKSGGTLSCNVTNWAITQPITVETGGTIVIYGAVTLLANGGVNLAGTLDIQPGLAVLDTASPILCTGDATIFWGTGNGDILGGLNANGFTVTHNNTAAGNSLVCDVAGILALGGDAPGLHINITAAITSGVLPLSGLTVDIGAGGSFSGAITSTADGNGIIMADGTSITGTVNIANTCTWTGGGTNTVNITSGTVNLGTTAANDTIVDVQASATVGGSFACGTLKHTGGTLTGGGKTITVGAGGFTPSGTAVLSGTLNVDLSGGAGAYTQTAGTIDTGAVLNVTTGTGAITFTALTNNGTINITMAPSTLAANIEWTSLSAPINRLTINTGVVATQTARVTFKRRDGAGTLVGGAQDTRWYPAANADVCDGPITGTATFYIMPTVTPLAIASSLNLGTRPASVTLISSSSTRTMTLSGITCGNLTVGDSGGGSGTATLILNGTSSGGALSLGNSTNCFGVATFNSGFVHTFTGAIQRGGTGTANALNLQGRCIFTGTWTGTGVACTPTGEGEIDCVGTGRVTAVVATGRRLVVRRAVHSSTGIPLRGWNDDSCVNTRFLGRKEIGAPGVR